MDKARYEIILRMLDQYGRKISDGMFHLHSAYVGAELLWMMDEERIGYKLEKSFYVVCLPD